MDISRIACNALAIDSRKLSTNPSKFCELNKFQYELAIKTWTDCIRQTSGEIAVEAVGLEVMGEGLVASIQRASDLSSFIIEGCADLEAVLPATWCLVCRELPARVALQVLRYLKRFTPIGCDLLDKSTIDDFKTTLNRNKLRDRSCPFGYRVDKCRDVISTLINDDDFTKFLCPTSTEGIPMSFIENGYFSAGVVWDAKPNCICNKLRAWHSPNFGDVMYPMPVSPAPVAKHAKVCVVPKNYKTKRTIAEEESERQYYMQGMRHVLRDLVGVGEPGALLPLDRQEDQQAKCFDRRYATIDLSKASDTITCSIAASLLPPSVYHWANALRADFLDIGDQCYLNTIFQTSGSALCFDLESIIFWGICKAATDTYCLFTGESALDPHVYGDDCVVDAQCFEMACEWLESFGFVVNHDKSYSDPSLFRESCGIEVFDDVEVSSYYWPRKEVKQHKSSLETLISLNNRLIDAGFYIAANAVLMEIRDIAGDKFTCTTLTSPYNATDPRCLGSTRCTSLSAARSYAKGAEVPDYEGHLCVTEVPSRTVSDVLQDDAYIMYTYVQYLLHGPLYEDPLMELLGVSTSRMRKDDGRCDLRTSLTIIPRI